MSTSSLVASPFVVVDLGSYEIKAGLAGIPGSLTIIPNCKQIHSNENKGVEIDDRAIFPRKFSSKTPNPSNFGHNIFVNVYHQDRGKHDLFSLKYPISLQRYSISNSMDQDEYKHISQGIPTIDWDLQSEILDFIFSHDCLRLDPKGRGILCTIPPLLPWKIIDKYAQVFFESYRFSEMYLSTSQYLAQYAHMNHIFPYLSASDRVWKVNSGKKPPSDLVGFVFSAGHLVIDIGHLSTHIVPFFSSEPLNYAIKRIDVGGTHMTQALKKLLSKQISLYPGESLVIDQLKHYSSRVAPSIESVIHQFSKTYGESFQSLPAKHSPTGKPLTWISSSPSTSSVTNSSILSTSPMNTKPDTKCDTSMFNYHFPSDTWPLGLAEDNDLQQDLHRKPNTKNPFSSSWGRSQFSFPGSWQKKIQFYETQIITSLDIKQTKLSSFHHLIPRHKQQLFKFSWASAPKKPDPHVYNTQVQSPHRVKQRFASLGVERYVVPEVLFQPTSLGIYQAGLIPAIVACVRSCPLEIQKAILQSISIIGGASQIPGLVERIHLDLKVFFPDSSIKIFTCPNPTTRTWEGGSTLASSPLFADQTISKYDYEENGSLSLEHKFIHLN